VQAELKDFQTRVKSLGSKRERLIGDVRVGEARVTQTMGVLKELSVPNAEKLTEEELRAGGDKTNAELIVNLDIIKGKMEEAEQVVAEYEATVQ